MMLLLVGALPVVAICAFVIVGYLMNRERLFEIARALQNKKAFSNPTVLAAREAVPSLPAKLADRLTGEAFQDAVSQLAKYARNTNPDWIVGVHPGGRLLSALVADSIGFPRERCLFVRTSSSRTNRIVFEPQRYKANLPLEGSMLVIDDISRSGKTLQSLKTFLIGQNYRIPNRSSEDYMRFNLVHFAVLLVVSDLSSDDYNFRPDWVFGRTDDKHFRLPWSELSADIACAFANRYQKLDFDEIAIKQHENLAFDFDYALELARRIGQVTQVTYESEPVRRAASGGRR